MTSPKVKPNIMAPKKPPFTPSNRNDPVSPGEVAGLKRDVSNFLSKVMDYAIKLPASERASSGFPSVDTMKDVKKRGQQAARKAERDAHNANHGSTTRAVRQLETNQGPRCYQAGIKRREPLMRQKKSKRKIMKRIGKDMQHQWGRDWKRAENNNVVENDKYFLVLGENGRDVLYLPGRY